MTTVAISTELRLRSRVADGAIRDTVAGKILTAADSDAILTGPTRILKPDGRPLCVYLPRAVADHAQDPAVYEVLHSLRSYGSTNRGLASGTRRHTATAAGQRSYAAAIASSVVGAVDPMGQQRYCRLTAWTGTHLPEWGTLHPLLRSVAEHLAEHVPDRYAAQAAIVETTDPAWVVPGTPFTTITVNNTYPTGVHTDKGDLDEGFSTIACLRRGNYTGGNLVFPAYRIAVDMHDGDLILMDAHEWHGNVAITCECGTVLSGCCETCGAERISVVAYYRTKMAGCGTPEEEYDKAAARAERRSGAG